MTKLSSSQTAMVYGFEDMLELKLYLQEIVNNDVYSEKTKAMLDFDTGVNEKCSKCETLNARYISEDGQPVCSDGAMSCLFDLVSDFNTLLGTGKQKLKAARHWILRNLQSPLQEMSSIHSYSLLPLDVRLLLNFNKNEPKCDECKLFHKKSVSKKTGRNFCGGNYKCSLLESAKALNVSAEAKDEMIAKGKASKRKAADSGKPSQAKRRKKIDSGIEKMHAAKRNEYQKDPNKMLAIKKKLSAKPKQGVHIHFVQFDNRIFWLKGYERLLHHFLVSLFSETTVVNKCGILHDCHYTTKPSDADIQATKAPMLRDSAGWSYQPDHILRVEDDFLEEFCKKIRDVFQIADGDFNIASNTDIILETKSLMRAMVQKPTEDTDGDTTTNNDSDTDDWDMDASDTDDSDLDQDKSTVTNTDQETNTNNDTEKQRQKDAAWFTKINHHATGCCNAEYEVGAGGLLVPRTRSTAYFMVQWTRASCTLFHFNNANGVWKLLGKPILLKPAKGNGRTARLVRLHSEKSRPLRPFFDIPDGFDDVLDRSHLYAMPTHDFSCFIDSFESGTFVQARRSRSKTSEVYDDGADLEKKAKDSIEEQKKKAEAAREAARQRAFRKRKRGHHPRRKSRANPFKTNHRVKTNKKYGFHYRYTVKDQWGRKHYIL